MSTVPTASELPVYRDGRHYDGLNESTTFDLEFFTARAWQAQGPVLELACGTGRVCLAIARAGMDVTGLDLSASMLAQAQRKAKSLAEAPMPFVQGDMRDFTLDRQFKLIFVAYDSFLYLLDLASQQAFFRAVKRALAPGGTLIIDAFNPLPRDLSPEFSAPSHLRTYPDPDAGGATVTIEQQARYDDARQLLHVQWHYRWSCDGRKKTEDIFLRCFFPQELDTLIELSGFEMIEKLGNYQGKTFGAGDPHQVVVCRPILGA